MNFLSGAISAALLLNPGIIGGRPANLHEWPAHVCLAFDDHPSFCFCSGTLITPQDVITAGHCISSMQEQQRLNTSSLLSSASARIVAIVGMHERTKSSSDWQMQLVANVVTHTFNGGPEVSADLALLHMAQPYTMTEAVTVAALSPLKPTEGMTGTVVGWGVYVPEMCLTDGPVADVLQKTDLTIIWTGESSQFAAHTPDALTCLGDSGDGFYDANSRLLGLVANGTSTGTGMQSIDVTWVCEHVLTMPGCLPGPWRTSLIAMR